LPNIYIRSKDTLDLLVEEEQRGQYQFVTNIYSIGGSSNDIVGYTSETIIAG